MCWIPTRWDLFEINGNTETDANAECAVMAKENGRGSDCVRMGFTVQ